MISKKFSVTLILALITLTGCESANSISGALNISKAFSFKDKNGKAQTLNGPKSYSASLNMNPQQTELAISTGFLSDTSIVIPAQLQDKTGSFLIAGSTFNQDFDINGDVEISSQVEDASHSESCVYSYHYERVCRDVTSVEEVKDHQGNIGKERITTTECNNEQVAEYGSAWVNETINVTTKSVAVAFLDASHQQMAEFRGSFQLSSDVVSRSEEACRR